jgi:hypothetical protein
MTFYWRCTELEGTFLKHQRLSDFSATNNFLFSVPLELEYPKEQFGL